MSFPGRVFLAGLVLGCTSLSQAVGLLLVQSRPVAMREPDPNHQMLQMMADQLDTDGRVIPLTWSMNDPVFRAAINDKKLKDTPTPTRENMQHAAEVMHCEYALYLSAWSDENGRLLTTVEVYKKGEKIYQYPIPIAGDNTIRAEITQVGGTADDSLRVAAGLWVDRLFRGPLQSLPSKVKIGDAPPLQGPNIRVQQPEPPVKVDNKQLLEDVMRLLSSGKGVNAIALLRDAVDAEPFDLERREVLVNTLLSLNFNKEAALQARRAANVLPEKSSLWALSAKAWMAAGSPSEAQEDLNQALARDPDNPGTRLLMAEVAVNNRDFESASQHLAVVFSKPGQSPAAYWLRALVTLFTKTDADAAADLAESQKGLAPLQEAQRYQQLVLMSNGMFDALGPDCRALFNEARANAKAAGLAQRVADMKHAISSADTAFSWVKVPDAHKASDGDRRLALKLLTQCLSELEAYLKQPDADALDDATINLGEALKTWRAALEAYDSEN